ncbi:hypothetical protein ElyMa_001476200 [Elysia marginata]|uniref:BHLH domain-containing protein n=1 Tax=Elysia marginata TaxID=1093978 RepID=A0AAV4J3R2_9GAST|nr:hypothetical protein ElyMa_001476200 [Elysia marginata]
MYDNCILSKNSANIRHNGNIQTSSAAAISHPEYRQCSSLQSYRSVSRSSCTSTSPRQSQNHTWMPNNSHHHHHQQQHQQQHSNYQFRHGNTSNSPPASNPTPSTTGSGSRSSQGKGSNHQQHHHHSPTSFVLHKLSSFSKRKSESDRRKVAERELDNLNSKIVSLFVLFR